MQETTVIIKDTPREIGKNSVISSAKDHKALLKSLFPDKYKESSDSVVTLIATVSDSPEK